MNSISKALPFSLEDVRISEKSSLYSRMMLNIEYLLKLDCDRLLFNFRKYADMDTKGVETYGGWEGPWSHIKGEFMGHYITACCNAHKSIDDTEIKQKLKNNVYYLVDSLGEVQTAIGKNGNKGYLAGIPTEQLDMLEELNKTDEFGVPYYVHHKTFRGLVNSYNAFGYQKALDIVNDLANYFYERLEPFDESHIEKMLNTHRYPVQFFKEFGGMHEVLIELYKITGDNKHLELAKIFDRPRFLNALYSDEDKLGENMQHANSEVPCVLGIGKYYELSGDEKYKKAMLNFLNWMNDGHSMATGGISGKSAYPDYDSELFNYPNIMFGHVTQTSANNDLDAGESCCSHNLNLLSEKAFIWTKDSRYAEEFENRFANAVLSQQDPKTGMFLYNLNMKQGASKGFGTEDDSFWCCYCSGIEAYSSLQYGAYFHMDSELWINNFIPSTLCWKEQDCKIRMETEFPDSGKIKLVVNLDKKKHLKLNIRIPSWVDSEFNVTFNDRAITTDKSGYIQLDREFEDGDTVVVEYPYSLKATHLIDRPEYVSVKYGPNLLVAVAPAFTKFHGSSQDLLDALKPTGVPNEFYTNSTTAGRVVFMPLNKVRNELYNGYTIVTKPIKEICVDEVIITSKDDIQNINNDKLKINFVDGRYSFSSGAGGWMSLDVKSEPDKRMFIQCEYNGSQSLYFESFDANNPRIRLFDIQVEYNGEYKTIATQHIDKLNIDGWMHINYPIPIKYTKDKKSLRIRFIAKDFGVAKGVLGDIFSIKSITY